MMSRPLPVKSPKLGAKLFLRNFVIFDKFRISSIYNSIYKYEFKALFNVKSKDEFTVIFKNLFKVISEIKVIFKSKLKA
jgi:hypothetical protein